jgi:hypothetical protein
MVRCLKGLACPKGTRSLTKNRSFVGLGSPGITSDPAYEKVDSHRAEFSNRLVAEQILVSLSFV